VAADRARAAQHDRKTHEVSHTGTKRRGARHMLPRTRLDQVLDLALRAVPRESYRVATRHDRQVGLAVQNW
jgi:hypothetical protein